MAYHTYMGAGGVLFNHGHSVFQVAYLPKCLFMFGWSKASFLARSVTRLLYILLDKTNGHHLDPGQLFHFVTCCSLGRSRSSGGRPTKEKKGTLFGDARWWKVADIKKPIQSKRKEGIKRPKGKGPLLPIQPKNGSALEVSKYLVKAKGGGA